MSSDEAVKVPEIRRELCARYLHVASQCAACAMVCPAKAVIGADGRPVIRKDLCSGCGACAAACPQGALVIPEETASAVQTEGSDAVIVCREAKTEEEAPKVPCIASADLTLLAELYASGVRSITAYTGKCASCARGGALKAWRIVKESAERLFPDLVIREEMRASRLDLGKRLFFRGFLRRAADAGSVNDPGALLNELLALEERKSVPEKQRRLIAALRASEKAEGSAFNREALAEIFAKPSVSENCTGCGLCARFCPTGALKFREKKGTLTVVASGCTVCGICSGLCFRKALDFAAADPETFLSDTEELLYSRDEGGGAASGYLNMQNWH